MGSCPSSHGVNYYKNNANLSGFSLSDVQKLNGPLLWYNQNDIQIDNTQLNLGTCQQDYISLMNAPLGASLPISCEKNTSLVPDFNRLQEFQYYLKSYPCTRTLSYDLQSCSKFCANCGPTCDEKQWGSPSNSNIFNIDNSVNYESCVQNFEQGILQGNKRSRFPCQSKMYFYCPDGSIDNNGNLTVCSVPIADDVYQVCLKNQDTYFSQSQINPVNGQKQCNILSGPIIGDPIISGFAPGTTPAIAKPSQWCRCNCLLNNDTLNPEVCEQACASADTLYKSVPDLQENGYTCDSLSNTCKKATTNNGYLPDPNGCSQVCGVVGKNTIDIKLYVIIGILVLLGLGGLIYFLLKKL